MNTPNIPPLPRFAPIQDSKVTALNDCSEIIHEWAVKKGWWDNPRNKGELIALMHSELSECLEFLRSRGCPACPHCPSQITECRGLDLEQGYIWKCGRCGKDHVGPNPEFVPMMDDKVPELTGEAAELADCVIRIFDYCGAFGINLGEAIQKKHAFNITRPYRHGGKKA